MRANDKKSKWCKTEPLSGRLCRLRQQNDTVNKEIGQRWLLLRGAIQALHTCRRANFVFIIRNCNWFWQFNWPLWLWGQMIENQNLGISYKTEYLSTIRFYSTAGEVYYSRAPIHTLGFSLVSMLSWGWYLFPILLCLWSKDSRLPGDGRLFPSLCLLEVSKTGKINPKWLGHNLKRRY